MAIDNNHKQSDNQGRYIIIEGDDQQLKIPKRDLVFRSTGGHKHHYMPDFTDEWDKAIALKCAIPGCIHGRMYKKEGKEFMDWLETHRAKAWGTNLLI